MTVPTLVAAVESSRVSSMFVFFFIALLIVSPFGYKRISAVMRERRAALAAPDGVEPAHDDGAAPESGRGPRDAADLAVVVEAIAALGPELARTPGASRSLDLPDEPLVEGRPAPAEVVTALLDDAVRRSGLTSELVVDADGRRRLHLTTR